MNGNLLVLGRRLGFGGLCVMITIGFVECYQDGKLDFERVLISLPPPLQEIVVTLEWALIIAGGVIGAGLAELTGWDITGAYLRRISDETPATIAESGDDRSRKRGAKGRPGAGAARQSSTGARA